MHQAARWALGTTVDAVFKRAMSLPQRPIGSSRVMITTTGFGACAIGGGG